MSYDLQKLLSLEHRGGGTTVVDWAQVLRTVGSTAVIVAAGAFLLREVFRHLLSGNPEKFKAELSAKHDVETERLRSDLKIAASERETRFTRLHEARVETIAGLYARLAHTHRAFDSYLRLIQLPGEGGQEEKEKEAVKCCRDLHEYFDEKRIYFEGSLCKAIDDSYDWCQRALSEMHGYPPGTSERGKKWEQTYKSLNEHFLPIRTNIERQFRGLIGVDTGSGNSDEVVRRPGGS